MTKKAPPPLLVIRDLRRENKELLARVTFLEEMLKEPLKKHVAWRHQELSDELTGGDRAVHQARLEKSRMNDRWREARRLVWRLQWAGPDGVCLACRRKATHAGSCEIGRLLRPGSEDGVLSVFDGGKP